MGGMQRVFDITGEVKRLGWKCEWLHINKPVNQKALWYIMVEGADGAGKSSIAKLFEATIRKSGAPVSLYHEPFYPQSLPAKPTAEDYQLDRERWHMRTRRHRILCLTPSLGHASHTCYAK